MTDHSTGTREEWRAARLELLEAEKELTRRSDDRFRRRDRRYDRYRHGDVYATKAGDERLRARRRCCLPPTPPTPAGWTRSGGCTRGSIARRRDATRPDRGSAAAT